MQQTNSQGTVSDTVYKDRYIILAIVLTGIAMTVLDGIVVNIALPTITSYFNESLQQAQWVITAYLLTLTSLMIIFGKISEYTGKVNLFIVGYSIFTLGSLACGLSSGMTWLIVFRVIQAVGGAIVFGGSGGIIFQAFPPSERGQAMGFLGSAIAVAGLAGPVLGGVIVYAIGWQYIFLINVPVGVVLLAAALRYLKIDEKRSKSLHLDWVGSAMLIVFMVSLVMLMVELADVMALTLPVIVYAVLFVLFLAAFILWESSYKEPVLDLSLFNDKRFTMPIVSMMINFVAIFMIALVGPFYLMGVMGFNALQVGLISLVSPVITVFCSPISGRLYDKTHSKYMSALGMLILAAAMLVVGFAQLSVSLPLLVIGMVISAIGGVIFQSPNGTESLSARPIDKVAMATSISSTARNLGMTLGTTLATIVLTFELASLGYGGPILGAGAADLAHVSCIVTFAAGALCVAGAVTSLLRNVSLAEIGISFRSGRKAGE